MALVYDRQCSPEQLQELLRAVYRQLLQRQPYHWEKAHELRALERDFLQRKINLRRLIRAVGHSSLYRRLFFEQGGNTRCVEQAFKHFLGRLPLNREEIATYHRILVKSGLGALVDALVDSDEYRRVFGNTTVPYNRHSGIAPISPYLTQRCHDSHQLFMPMLARYQVI